MKVLFIAGFGRSGTTVVDSILGQVEGFSSLGEAQYAWDRGLEQNLLCGCGAPFRECSLWGSLAEDVSEGLEPEDLRRMASFRDRQGPGRTVARALSGRLLARQSEWRDYVARTATLYRNVQRVTGSQVLIDSSKSPFHGLVLDQIPDLELHVLHMVRNPRAVAHSWRKRKVYDDSGEEPMYMARLSLRSSAAKWLAWNAAIEALWRRRRDRYRLLAYEAFAAAPRATLASVLEQLGEEDAILPFTDSRTVELGTVHSVAGNPSRFETGPVRIRNDERWKRRMGARDQLLVAGLTLPLLVRYGYARPLVAR